MAGGYLGAEVGAKLGMRRIEKRGIRIPLSGKSWQLVIQALRLVAKDESNHELDEQREDCGRIADYIDKHL